MTPSTVDEGSTAEGPQAFTLYQNSPNPFNPATTLPFELDENSMVMLTVYDSTGRLIRTLADRQFTVGRHTIVWDGADDSGKTVSSGVYLYRLEAGGMMQSRRMVLVR